MSHSVSETAARAVKNSERKNVAIRTPEEIIKNIRASLPPAHVFVTPADIQVLLAEFDKFVVLSQAAVKEGESNFALLQAEHAEVLRLQEQIEQFRAENKILHENVRLSAEFMTTSNDTISKLIEQVEQFRAVYDEENSSKGTVSLEAIPATATSLLQTGDAGFAVESE